MWRVPLSKIEIEKDEIDSVINTLKSGWLSMGEQVKTFEDEWKKYFDINYAFAVSNGTAALHLSCLAAGFGPGDEVIVPSLTFVATSNAVIYCGAKPVFVDVNTEDDLTLSTLEIEKKITSNTKGIILMHYGGYPCDMDSIITLARKYNLVIIEDGAHCPGAEINNTKLGTIGDFGCFSFFPNKNITTGEGGMIITKNVRYANKIKSLRSHYMTTLTWDRHQGHAKSYDVTGLGYNYRLDELRASIGIKQLQKLEFNNQKRGKIVNRYINLLENEKDFTIPFVQHRGKSAYHLFVINTNNLFNKNKIEDHLKKMRIQTSFHYPPVHLFSYYKKHFPEVTLPITERLSNKLITLPLFPSMTYQEQDYVVKSIKDAMQ
ncbi:DegT/DnrJ/EryC1/StrS aminotransferase family protein [Paraliobacillus sp. X-1268]|uniref:DegT/DnrJ/EryC1/StrS family aminotransferase n=1 Tax=Paraliobacillus sp. X-1268 TaxID=2213193 RepID=UPI000E3EC0D2|nr:DegT/DnrJ/EryC1/StrS family aminotransferase [Paraliobacillus sp. X-1268]